MWSGIRRGISARLRVFPSKGRIVRIAMAGADYCGQYFSVPTPHELVSVPYRETIGGMFAAANIPMDWPDVFVAVLAEMLPVPLDIGNCPCPTVAVIEDWELWGDSVLANGPGYDYILADQSGVDALSRWFPDKMRTFCPVWNFGNVHPEQASRPLFERPIDVVFVGSFNPVERFPGRNRALSWLYPLCERFNIQILTRIPPGEFETTLCSSKIIFNHAASLVQSGINARNFEGGACRAVMMGEVYNHGLQTFFSNGEILFYDKETLAERIEWVLTHPEEAQTMADRCYEKTNQPLMPSLLQILEDILRSERPARGVRTLEDVLVGLCCGFPNWGAKQARFPAALTMMFQVVRHAVQSCPDNPTVLNLSGVAMAELADEMERAGSAEADSFRRDATYAPERLWRQAMQLDAEYVSPLYNLARHTLRHGRQATGMDLLLRALRLLEDRGGEAMRRRTLFYPVHVENGVCLDRILTATFNTAPFLYEDEAAAQERQANALKWRIHEILGDFSYRRGNDVKALASYRAAANACPEVATDALRKASELAERGNDTTSEIECLEHLIRINPLDAPYRERLAALYERRGTPDAELVDEIRLLRRAIPQRQAFARPEPERAV